MARKYTSKETKQLIDLHKENLKKLEASLLLPEKAAARVRDCVNNMLLRDDFRHIVMNSLSRQQDETAKTGDLIRYLYLLKRTSEQADICRNLLSESKSRIENYIDEASSAGNAISWVFSSQKKKQAAEDACEMLENELNDGYYWSSSRKVLSEISENLKISAKESLDDLAKNQNEYADILRNNLPASQKLSEPVTELNDLISRFSEISRKLSDETSKTEDLKEEIKKSADRMVMAQALEILKTVPVDELNRDRKGIRIKSLKDDGYTTMADVYKASAFKLANVNGISEDTSYLIKNIAEGFANEAKRSARIQLSADNQTQEASSLISSLSKYRQYASALDAFKKFESEYSIPVSRAIRNLKTVGSGLYWPLYNDEQKTAIKHSYAYLCEALKGDYSRKADEILRMFQSAGTASSENVWGDFTENSIPYVNTLEEIVPGVLGNNDQQYGLPEVLAEEVKDENISSDGLKCELRRYQEWGVKYILHQGKVLLGDEMGLGKTVQAIAAMVSLKNTGATHFIVVCPASVLPNWCKEIESKSTLKAVKVHGTGKQTVFDSWINNGGVAVTTYETTGIFRFDSDFRYDFLVVDEAHFIKNINAIRSRNVRELASHAKRILFMTGTALENRVDEMISLIDVLNPEVAKSIQGISFMSAAPQFREKIAGVYYRRKREDVLTELPDLIESREWCTLSKEENKLYEKDVLCRNFMGIRRLSWNVEDLKDSCKAQRMMEIIEEAESENRKILIFSFFLDTIRKIREYLGDRCCDSINGSIPPQRRQEIIDQFESDSNKSVLCAQIQSGGTGLNIQAASVVIICEPQFKPSVENQAISRAYRMGQARNVLVYRLLCEKTVDERMTELLSEKQAIFDAFADKSSAAEKTAENEKELDETTFGNIIDEEIERIKAENNSLSV